MRNAIAALMLVALAGVGCSQQSRQMADRDNTAVNERDRPNNAKTPIDQNENKQDIEMTANVRQRILKEDVSVNARNVKIITQDGKITLRGPVKSQDEKDLVERIAQDVAGAEKVDNQIEVEARP